MAIKPRLNKSKVAGPGAGVFGRPQGQRLGAQVDDAGVGFVGQLQLHQALADEAGDLAGLAVGTAGAGDDGVVEHLGFPF